MTQTTPFLPDWASAPGDTLADMLDERSMTQTELAERLGMSLKHVNRVVKGAASVSAELALGLEKVFGVSAAFWMTREAHFQIDRARQQQRRDLVSAVTWAKQFPVAELRKRRLLPREGEGAELVEQLLGFLGVAHPDQWPDPKVAYRKTQKFKSDAYALSAWLREGELKAAEIDCAPYNEDRFLDVLQDVRSLTQLETAGWWPALQDRCAAAGVAVVIVDSYPKSRANGATRWLTPDKALVQLSVRYLWADIFWFSFFHEAGHVVLHRKKERFVELPGRDTAADAASQQQENEADRFAARTLIPRTREHRLRGLDLAEVEAFASNLGISPGIVVGRMQHDGLPHNQGNDLRKKVDAAVVLQPLHSARHTR